MVAPVSSVSCPASAFERATVPPGGALDHYFEQERSFLRARIEREPEFAPFRQLPDGLVSFLVAEKGHLALAEETRQIVDAAGKCIGGVQHGYSASDDRFHPKYFEPFQLKGYWIPESEGRLFSNQSEGTRCPLIRTTPQGREILFLVHPKSEKLFSQLMDRYKEQQEIVPAIALSSFRTLLIAVGGTYTMVKVSLDEKIGNVVRLLGMKECAGSIAAAALLQHKSSKISFVRDDFSFVPNAICEKGAGMIHRVIPDALVHPAPHEYTVPLYHLFGTLNRPLLDLLIEQSKKSPTQFVVENILQLLADQFIELLFCQKVSIEVHGQNLLLVINSQGDIQIKFLYRDMGGVNCLLSASDRQKLPAPLRDDSFFYQDKHIKDAADVLEGLATKVLFNLTKTFLKSPQYDQRDAPFAHWKSEMAKSGYSQNWHIASDNPDAHQQKLAHKTFYRYGYFEKIFGRLILESMSQKGIFVEITDLDPTLTYSYFLNQLIPQNDPYSRCLEIKWFETLIQKTLPLYRTIDKR